MIKFGCILENGPSLCFSINVMFGLRIFRAYKPISIKIEKRGGGVSRLFDNLIHKLYYELLLPFYTEEIYTFIHTYIRIYISLIIKENKLLILAIECDCLGYTSFLAVPTAAIIKIFDSKTLNDNNKLLSFYFDFNTQ